MRNPRSRPRRRRPQAQPGQWVKAICPKDPPSITAVRWNSMVVSYNVTAKTTTQWITTDQIIAALLTQLGLTVDTGIGFDVKIMGMRAWSAAPIIADFRQTFGPNATTVGAANSLTLEDHPTTTNYACIAANSPTPGIQAQGVSAQLVNIRSSVDNTGVLCHFNVRWKTSTTGDLPTSFANANNLRSVRQ